MSAIYHFPPQTQISQSLQRRMRNRISSWSDDAIFGYLADTLYTERRRIEEDESGDTPPMYLRALQTSAQAIQKNREAMCSALLELVHVYSAEIHNNFSERTYRIASKVLPSALSRLLTASQPAQLMGADFDPGSKIIVQGAVKKIQKLSQTHTLIYTPTHLSNLDSPLIGYALAQLALPPVIYGAGLNLFSNPLMAFFMSRLGAYTVDRRKKNLLYKDVLKDYSIDAIRRKCHSLFFPGGTRCRSGQIEKQIKKGLLGTGIAAWQEALREQDDLDVLFVPCTLSFALTLEAETLIEDHLAEEGKARYIITDDEFSETRTLASFGRNILNLDSSVYIRFGAPLDITGNSVDEIGRSLDPNGKAVDRKKYVCNRFGEVVLDKQRDRIYTDLLAKKITKAYYRDNIILSTHVAAFSAWKLLSQLYPRLNDVQKSMLTHHERRLSRTQLLQTIDLVQKQVRERAQSNLLCHDISKNPADILHQALHAFGRFHRTHVLTTRGEFIEVGAKLALYYSNRLEGYGISAMEKKT